jgi:hypothetical protein
MRPAGRRLSPGRYADTPIMAPAVNQVTVDIDPAFGAGRDFDVALSGEWVGVFETAPRKQVVRCADSRSFVLSRALALPAVRLLGSERILLVDQRVLTGRANGYIFERDGTLLSEFFAGDGIHDVVVLSDLFAVTYVDEGVFSGVPPSEQGIAFFDFEGRYLWGYQSLMGSDAVEIADCYCAVRVDHHTLAFSAYTRFQLVRLQPRTGKQRLDEMWPTLRGASALSMKGDTVFLYGPYEHKKAMFAWRPGQKPVELGKHSGPLRGLERGRFLSCGEHGFTIVEAAA